MDNNISLSNLAQHFNDDDSARELLEHLRWPNGAVCPHCNCKRVYKLEPKPNSKRPVRQGVYKCGECLKQFTVTVNTIFEDSHIPLHKWLLAIHLICSNKNGVSSHELHRTLGITYKSAWFMSHRIRYAMTQSPLKEKLLGTIEADETYIGGRNFHGKRGRGSENKTPVFALIQRDGEVRSFKTKSVTSKNLKDMIREHVNTNSQVMTDEFLAYKGLSKEFASHQTVNHGSGQYVNGNAHTNTAEGYFSLLKRGINGTYHHVSDKHLSLYLNEFNFRYNNRKVNDSVRTCLAVDSVEGKRLMFA